MPDRFANSGKLCAALLVCSSIPFAAGQKAPPDDPAAIVHHALLENTRDLKEMRKYIYLSDKTADTLDNNGQVKKSTRRREEIFYLDGAPTERILEQDGRPLSTEEQAKQEARLNEQIREAHSPNPTHKQERERKAAKAFEEEMALRADVAAGFQFTIAAEEQRGGDRCIKLSAEPRKEYKGKSSIHALLPFLHGSIWIDVDKGQWLDIDAAPVRRLGEGMVYVNDDSAIHLHQEQVAEGLWVMTREDVRIDGRLLWDRKNIHVVKSLSDFKKFSSSARLLTATSEPAGEDAAGQGPGPQ